MLVIYVTLLVAEERALRHGIINLRFGEDFFYFSKIQVECDSKRVIDYINQKCATHWHLRTIINNIKDVSFKLIWRHFLSLHLPRSKFYSSCGHFISIIVICLFSALPAFNLDRFGLSLELCIFFWFTSFLVTTNGGTKWATLRAGSNWSIALYEGVFHKMRFESATTYHEYHCSVRTTCNLVRKFQDIIWFNWTRLKNENEIDTP